MQAQSKADAVRQYARINYIEPARKRHQATVSIKSGDVVKGLHLQQRTPLVCQALRGPKFLDENNLTLEGWEGPESGQSTTVVFTYRFARKNAKRDDWKNSPLMRLEGIGKDVFASLGGGEAFIRREREHFYSLDDDEKP